MAQTSESSVMNKKILFHKDDYFHEELNPELSESLGGFKTTNPEGDRFQRQMLHVSSAKSKFKKTVELVLCAHGWKHSDRKEPMTLIVLGINLSCHTRHFRFQSVRIWLTFDEDNKRNPSDGVIAYPHVIAYAPFVQQERWNVSTANITDNRELEAGLSVNQLASVNVSGSRSHEISYTRKHFDRGSADRLYDDKTGRTYGVEWYCEQNQLQKYGVQPNFHLAVLLGRLHDKENAISFKARFDMQIEAGFIHDFEQGLRRAFRLQKPEDDPVYFDPSKEPDVHGAAGIGQKLLEKIDLDNLGALAEGNMLSKLLDATGALSGIEPMMAV